MAGHGTVFYEFSQTEGVYTPVSLIYDRSLSLHNDTLSGTTFEWKIGTRIASTDENPTFTAEQLAVYNDQIIYNPSDPTGAYFQVTLTVDGKYVGTRNIVLEHNLP
jgi:hypothetical protein